MLKSFLNQTRFACSLYSSPRIHFTHLCSPSTNRRNTWRLLPSPPKMTFGSLADAKQALTRLAWIPPYRDTYEDYTDRAGVLVPLLNCPTLGLCTVLTLRASHLRSHAGEVSFPGGKFEHCDTSLRETAMREAREEIHMDTTTLRFLTTFQPLRSIAGVWVHPVLVEVPVTTSAEDLLSTWRPNVSEVETVFLVPVARFLEAKGHHSRAIGRRYLHQFEVAWKQQVYQVWGLTALLCIQMATVALDKSPEFDIHFQRSWNLPKPGKL